MTTGPGFRLARSAIFAGACVATTGLGHALMSGDALPGRVVGSAFAVVVLATWFLTGRERGAAMVTGATVVTQIALHLAFTLASPQAGPDATSSTAHHMAGMGTGSGMSTGSGASTGMAHMHHAVDSASMASGHAHMASGHGTSLGMVLAHALAGLLCGLWLWRGEAAVFRLGRALTAFLFAPLELAVGVFTAAAVHQAPLSVRPFRRGGHRLRRLLLRHAVPRRGPPVRPVCV
ncbi:hypothetical protein [Streptomyces himalayensis]|uniref:Integral membrane protein n=1 Tax=Streptomyces himalayensis subsp. himalayensis TaxID=2756131 RepID=A0A7W0DKC5_9ACTN|nr:hypothetical protein [Streptomyces himalayensis]MBA2946694.1 hypothetical protein [Streptomyces himalayensis subsp. himalayensis]